VCLCLLVGSYSCAYYGVNCGYLVSVIYLYELLSLFWGWCLGFEGVAIIYVTYLCVSLFIRCGGVMMLWVYMLGMSLGLTDLDATI